jgi:hypothetical protein
MRKDEVPICSCIRQGRNGCAKIGRGVTEEDKQTILKLHDDYRSEVASGAVRIHDVTLPEATAMAKMVPRHDYPALSLAWTVFYFWSI